MPLVRLAAIEDYEAFDMLGCTMYRIAWCEKLCPGNPTESPIEGVALFNRWQCEIASGNIRINNPVEKLDQIITWCLSNDSITAVQLALEIVKRAKDPTYTIGLEFDTDSFNDLSLAYRYELAFLNTQVAELPAAKVLQLQNSIQVTK